MTVDKDQLDGLTQRAKESPRLRMNLDMRTSPEDLSQRMLNALEPGTVLPIHRHRNTTECVFVVRGRIRQNFYDDNGVLTGSWVIAPDSPIVGITVPCGQWHNTESLESGTVIFEAKDGAYEPLSETDILK